LSAVAAADRKLLWAAALGFAASLLANAAAWRSTINAVGARMSWKDACAYYGVGSIVNTLLPARLGDAVRVGLFAKALPSEQTGRGLTAAGALGAVSAAEALTQVPLLGAASGLGVVPWWLAIVVVGVGSAVVALMVATSGRLLGGRLRPLLAASRALGASPRGAVPLLLWSTAATAGRVLAAAAIAAALGAANPLEAGVIVSAVLCLATAVPLTPGNVGVTSGAVVLALHARGVPLTSAVGAGLAFHAVETAAGLAFGIAGTIVLARDRSVAARRWSLTLAGGLAGLLVAVAALGTTVFPAA
jgi:uncharacterized membrane protein YbhN (UPF0104 family)